MRRTSLVRDWEVASPNRQHQPAPRSNVPKTTPAPIPASLQSNSLPEEAICVVVDGAGNCSPPIFSLTIGFDDCRHRTLVEPFAAGINARYSALLIFTGFE